MVDHYRGWRGRAGSLRNFRFGVLLGGGLAVVLTLASYTALAQPSGRTLTRTPAQGSPGTSIALSGTGCFFPGRPAESVFARLASRAGTTGGPFDTSAEFPVKPDGTWSGQIVVPPDAPAGEYSLSASCVEGDALLSPEESDFRVLPGPPSPDGGSSPGGRPAVPVAGQPSFTG